MWKIWPFSPRSVISCLFFVCREPSDQVEDSDEEANAMQDQTFSYKSVKSLATPKVSNHFLDSSAKKAIVAAEIIIPMTVQQAVFLISRKLSGSIEKDDKKYFNVSKQLEGIWKGMRQLWGRAYSCLGDCYPLWLLGLEYLFPYSLSTLFTAFLFGLRVSLSLFSLYYFCGVSFCIV